MSLDEDVVVVAVIVSVSSVSATAPFLYPDPNRQLKPFTEKFHMRLEQVAKFMLKTETNPRIFEDTNPT